CQQYDSDTHTF
nr:immunoglobulin light chain junction region [Macaca mulatta]